MKTAEAGDPAKLGSDTGAWAEKSAGAANPAKSTLRLVGDTVAAVKLGAQLLPAGWREIIWRVMKRLGNDNVTLVAGGIAMYALLSVFPGLAAAVSIYRLFATPGCNGWG